MSEVRNVYLGKKGIFERENDYLSFIFDDTNVLRYKLNYKSHGLTFRFSIDYDDSKRHSNYIVLEDYVKGLKSLCSGHSL